MGKLRVFSGKEVCEILQKHDFIEIRRRESHILMQRKSTEGTVTIPIPNHHELRIERYDQLSDNQGYHEVSLRLNLIPCAFNRSLYPCYP